MAALPDSPHRERVALYRPPSLRGPPNPPPKQKQKPQPRRRPRYLRPKVPPALAQQEEGDVTHQELTEPSQCQEQQVEQATKATTATATTEEQEQREAQQLGTKESDTGATKNAQEAQRQKSTEASRPLFEDEDKLTKYDEPPQPDQSSQKTKSAQDKEDDEDKDEDELSEEEDFAELRDEWLDEIDLEGLSKDELVLPAGLLKKLEGYFGVKGAGAMPQKVRRSRRARGVKFEDPSAAIGGEDVPWWEQSMRHVGVAPELWFDAPPAPISGAGDAGKQKFTDSSVVLDVETTPGCWARLLVESPEQAEEAVRIFGQVHAMTLASTAELLQLVEEKYHGK